MFDVNGDGVRKPVYYNGFAAGEDLIGPADLGDAGLNESISSHSTSCAKALGIEHMANTCVQGRAAMIDLRAHYGGAPTLIGYDEMMRVLEARSEEHTSELQSLM